MYHSSYEALKNIDYNTDAKTGGGYCNFTYQLENVAEMVNGNAEITKVASYTPENTYTKCTKYSDEGEVCYKATECHYEGIKRCCKFEDHSTSCYDPTEECYFDENNQRCCKYGDNTLRCENINNWEFSNDKCNFTYYDGSVKIEDFISQRSICSSTTSCLPNSNGNKLCKYCRDKFVPNSCADKTEKYCTKDDNLDKNSCETSISWASNYYCSFYGNSKDKCTKIIEKYCPAKNSASSLCSDSLLDTSKVYCRFVDGKENNTEYCIDVTRQYCTKDDNLDKNSCETSISWASNYYCTFYGNEKDSCKKIVDKYCPAENSASSLCSNSLLDTSTAYCRFYDSEKIPEDRTTIFINLCNSFQQDQSNIYCRQINNSIQNTQYCSDVERMYCASTELSYNECHNAPTSSSENNKCVFVGQININNCKDATENTLYCPSYNSEYSSCKENKTSKYYSCTFIDKINIGDCLMTLYCPSNSTSNTISSCSEDANINTKALCKWKNQTLEQCVDIQTSYMYCPNNTSRLATDCSTEFDINKKYRCLTLKNAQQTVWSNSKQCDLITTNQQCSSNQADATCVSSPATYTCATYAGKIVKNSCTKNEETKYCSTNNPSTDSGCATSITPDNYYKCKFVKGNRSGNCTDMRETKYCSTNNPSTDSGCAASVSTANYYECTFVAGTRSGNCTDMRETKYCSSNNPNTDTNCTTSMTADNYYECTFVAGTRSENCVEVNTYIYQRPNETFRYHLSYDGPCTIMVEDSASGAKLANDKEGGRRENSNGVLCSTFDNYPSVCMRWKSCAKRY